MTTKLKNEIINDVRGGMTYARAATKYGFPVDQIEGLFPKKKTKIDVKGIIQQRASLRNLKFIQPSGSKGFRKLSMVNRPIIPAHVTKISKSIMMMGMIRPVVIATIDFITGSPEQYIIDGQHGYEACERIGVEIPYIEIKIVNERDLVEKIALLNASSKSWQMSDYVFAWSYISEDYKILNKLYSRYDFSIDLVAAILMNMHDSGIITRKIKTGLVKVENEAAADDLLKKISEVMNIIPRVDRWKDRYTIREYLKFYRELGERYDHAHFLKVLNINKSNFLLATQDEEILKDFFKKLYFGK